MYTPSFTQQTLISRNTCLHYIILSSLLCPCADTAFLHSQEPCSLQASTTEATGPSGIPISLAIGGQSGWASPAPYQRNSGSRTSDFTGPREESLIGMIPGHLLRCLLINASVGSALPRFWHKKGWQRQGSHTGNRITAHECSYTEVIGFYTNCLKENTWQISQRAVETGSICFKISVKKEKKPQSKRTHKINDLRTPQGEISTSEGMDLSVHEHDGQRLLMSSFGAEFEIWFIDTHSTGVSFLQSTNTPEIVMVQL